MQPHPRPGTVFLDKYRIESVIGQGGMGVVLKARHLELDKDVAIKILLPEMQASAEVVARFLREAKAVVKLKGEHITRVLDVGRLPDAGTPYIVMEFLDGADLNKIIKRHGPQHPAVAVDLMLQACEAIAEAHSIGIVHRDLKGSNFFVTHADGEASQLKVLDFGMATAPDGISELTSASTVLGTPAYMAPEQISATRSADARSDLWSLGIVLYEMLEGKRPFRADVYYDLCIQIRTEPPPPVSRGELPAGLEAAILVCLVNTRDARYQTVAEFAAAIAPFATDPALAHTIVEQCVRYARRSGRVEQRADGEVSGGHATGPVSAPRRDPTLPIRRDSTPIPRHDPTLQVRRDRTPRPRNGEVGTIESPRRRQLGLIAVAVGAIALGGIFLATRGGPDSTPTPAPPTVPARPKPTKPAPKAQTTKPRCQPPDHVNRLDDTPVCPS